MNNDDLHRRILEILTAVARLQPDPTARPWGVSNGESGDHGESGDDCPLVGGAFVQFGARDHVVAITIDASAADYANAEAITFVLNRVVGVLGDLALELNRRGPALDLQRILARIVLDHEAWGGSSGVLTPAERLAARAWAREVLT